MNDFLSQCRHLRFSTPSGSCKQTVSGNEGRTVAICEITCALIWTVCITFIEKIQEVLISIRNLVFLSALSFA